MKKPIIIEIIIWCAILCALFCGIIFTYSKLFVEPNVYNIEFKDIDGITKGSPVRFMGIIVGHVRSLKSKDKHINVQIIITKKDMKIPNGTIARVEFYGLGGSKSIELMPPDGSCDVGILTGYTIRINDVAQEASDMVEVVEEIEKFVKTLNRSSMQTVLESVIKIKGERIDNVGNDFNTMKGDIANKAQELRVKQKDFRQKIEQINTNVEKINKFIKK